MFDPTRCRCGTQLNHPQDDDATRQAGFSDYVRCSDCIALIQDAKTANRPKEYKPRQLTGRPRGRTQSRVRNARTGKMQIRVHKKDREGYCPHCGEYCAPYYECEERRAYYRRRYAERKAVTV